MPLKKEVQYAIFFGDSLTAQNTEALLKLLSGLSMNSKSKEGCYTDGNVWVHFLMQVLAKTDTNYNRKIASLKQSQNINAIEHRVVRNFAQGGLTSFNYNTTGINVEFTASSLLSRMMQPNTFLQTTGARATLPSLEETRIELSEQDRVLNTQIQQKNKTVIFELTGANDLLTVNFLGDIDTAIERSIEARCENIKKLILDNYSNFIILNLPPLSKTPRFAQDERGRKRVETAIEKYNQQLLAKINLLTTECVSDPNVKISLYDVHKILQDACDNPTKYGVTAENFWFDEVHPSSALHKIMGEIIASKLLEEYTFVLPDLTDPLDMFYQTYTQLLYKESQNCGASLRNSRLLYEDPSISLEQIVWHGLYNGGNRTKYVMQQLQWIDSNGAYQDSAPISVQKAVTFCHNAAKQDTTFRHQAESTNLIEKFRQTYKAFRHSDSQRLWASFRRYRLLEADPNLSLQQIVWHGLYADGKRTRNIMLLLKWIDKHGNAINLNPQIKEAITFCQNTAKARAISRATATPPAPNLVKRVATWTTTVEETQLRNSPY
jgi:phospholipase/lecithinase/hemolysin